MDARRRHQGGEAVEQLERRQELRAAAAGARLREVVDEVLALELAQPVQGEWWPDAVTQQTLASGTVSSLYAHRAVHGEATAVFPLRHRPRVIARQEATPHEGAQHALTHLRLHPGDGGGIEPGGGMEDDPARGGRVEHAVDDYAVEVQVSREP